MNSLIAAHLALGATPEQIYSFLDDNKIEHQPLGTGYSELIADGFGSDTPVIYASIPDTSNQPIGRTDLDIYFVMDANHRLLTYLVKNTVISL